MLSVLEDVRASKGSRWNTSSEIELVSVVERISSSEPFRVYASAFQRLTGLSLSLVRCSDSFAANNLDHLFTDDPYQVVQFIGDTLQEKPGNGAVNCFLAKDGRGVHSVWIPILAKENKPLVFLSLREHVPKAPHRRSTCRSRELDPLLVELNRRDIVTAVIPFANDLALCLNTAWAEISLREPMAIVKARQVISEGYKQTMKVRDVAQAVGMSVAHFSRCFRKVTNQTFTAFVARCRLERAERLMGDPNKRISEIAFEAGFESMQQFNRVFKRLRGKSPREFRASRALSA